MNGAGYFDVGFEGKSMKNFSNMNYLKHLINIHTLIS